MWLGCQDPNKCIATEKEILSILPIKDLQQCENRRGRSLKTLNKKPSKLLHHRDVPKSCCENPPDLPHVLGPRLDLETLAKRAPVLRLVQVLQYENFEFTKLLLKNRLKILCPPFSPTLVPGPRPVSARAFQRSCFTPGCHAGSLTCRKKNVNALSFRYCTRLGQAQTEEDKTAVLEDMRNTPEAQAVLEAGREGKEEVLDPRIVGDEFSRPAPFSDRVQRASGFACQRCS